VKHRSAVTATVKHRSAVTIIVKNQNRFFMIFLKPEKARWTSAKKVLLKKIRKHGTTLRVRSPTHPRNQSLKRLMKKQATPKTTQAQFLHSSTRMVAMQATATMKTACPHLITEEIATTTPTPPNPTAAPTHNRNRSQSRHGRHTPAVQRRSSPIQ
jgi:hypothetical protein